MRIAMSIGHGYGNNEFGELLYDPGAINKSTGLTEFEAVKQIGFTLWSMLEYSSVEVVTISSCSLEEKIQIINAEHKREFIELAIEIHLNAPSPSVGVETPAIDAAINGTEVWYYPGSAIGNLAAQHLQVALVKTLGFRNRRIRSNHTLAFLRNTKPAAILTEAAFITHDPVAIALKEGSLVPRIAWGHALGIWNFVEALQ